MLNLPLRKVLWLSLLLSELTLFAFHVTLFPTNDVVVPTSSVPLVPFSLCFLFWAVVVSLLVFTLGSSRNPGLEGSMLVLLFALVVLNFYSINEPFGGLQGEGTVNVAASSSMLLTGSIQSTILNDHLDYLSYALQYPTIALDNSFLAALTGTGPVSASNLLLTVETLTFSLSAYAVLRIWVKKEPWAVASSLLLIVCDFIFYDDHELMQYSFGPMLFLVLLLLYFRNRSKPNLGTAGLVLIVGLALTHFISSLVFVSALAASQVLRANGSGIIAKIQRVQWKPVLAYSTIVLFVPVFWSVVTFGNAVFVLSRIGSINFNLFLLFLSQNVAGQIPTWAFVSRFISLLVISVPGLVIVVYRFVRPSADIRYNELAYLTLPLGFAMLVVGIISLGGEYISRIFWYVPVLTVAALAIYLSSLRRPKTNTVLAMFLLFLVLVSLPTFFSNNRPTYEEAVFSAEAATGQFLSGNTMHGNRTLIYGSSYAVETISSWIPLARIEIQAPPSHFGSNESALASVLALSKAYYNSQDGHSGVYYVWSKVRTQDGFGEYLIGTSSQIWAPVVQPLAATDVVYNDFSMEVYS